MSSYRRLIPEGYHKRPTPGTCRWCQKPVLDKKTQEPSTRRWWHTECADAYMMANHSAKQREICWERDKGVCASCALDTEKARIQAIGQSELDRWLLSREMQSIGLLRPFQSCTWNPHANKQLETLRKERGWPKDIRATWWNADHKVALCNANGDPAAFTADNLQTLCFRCHNAKTKADVAKLHGKATPPQLALL